MLRVLITCPTAHRLVPTGWATTRQTFETATEADLRGKSFQCPECGELHRWTLADARLEQERALAAAS